MKRTILSFMFLMLGITLSVAMGLSVNSHPVGKNKTKETVDMNAKWEFYSIIKPPEARELANESNYKFGEEAGCLYTLFLNTYVVREEVVPGDPARRTVIRKPAIYSAVRAIEKQLGKELKNKTISKEEAATEFSNVLKVAISAFDSDSQSFENALQANRRDMEALLAVFKHVKLTEI